MGMAERTEPVSVVGPKGIRAMVEAALLAAPPCELPVPLRFSELEAGFSGYVKETASGLRVSAYPIEHGPPTWGYVLQEPDRAGKLDAKKARTMGAAGPQLGQLKNGQDITLADGGVVKASDVVSPPQQGRSFAVLQDCCDASGAADGCKGVDVLIHECTFEEGLHELALKKGHSTSKMAAEFAESVRCKRLVLTHFSARYTSSSGSPDDPAEQLGKEAEVYCSMPVTVAKDFMVLDESQECFGPLPELSVKRPAWTPLPDSPAQGEVRA
mmetsp:Transcript_55123/g.126635  ORF Transcript_55123/g.126635 Transcript_55123/m.126635 type:complete len:270 (-) Transcript_55123:230-1039(-)